MSEDKVNIIDKVTSDDTRIVISSGSVKWVIGILSGAVIGILGFAWGLYIKVDGKVDTQYDNLNKSMEKNKTEIINKMTELDKEKVKPNADKNHAQDLDIVRLYERVDSKNDNINGSTSRPEILNNTNNGSVRPSFNN